MLCLRELGSVGRRLGAIIALVWILAGLAAGPAFALTVEEIVSPKGIKAWLVEEHSVPLIAIRFAFVGGSVQDPQGKEGLAALMSDLVTEGAGDLPADAFKARFLQLGARLSAAAGRDAIFGGLETLSARFAPSAELLRMALVAPRFDADAIEQIRAEHLTDLAQASKVPNKIAAERWYAEAFPGHPYARPISGTPASVGQVTRDDLKAQHARLFARDVLRIVIVGNVGKAAAIEAIDTIFGGLPEKAQVAAVAKVEPRPVPTPVVIAMEQPLATANFGLPSLSVDHPDFPALQVLNHVIGSGDFDSSLMEEVRVKRGLAYSIQTSLVYDSISALMLGGFATKNENMGTALGVVRDVLASTARDGPPQEKFDNAKRYLTGSFLLDFDTNAKVAGSLLNIWLRGNGPDYLEKRNQMINAVTLADAKRVARQILDADRMIVVIVGKPKLGE